MYKIDRRGGDRPYFLLLNKYVPKNDDLIYLSTLSILRFDFLNRFSLVSFSIGLEQGWARSWWNDRSFPRTNGTIKNDPIVLKKNAQNAFLKMLEQLIKERNGNCLKSTVIIVNAFLLSRTCSKLGTHFKSGMCSLNPLKI